MIWLSDIAAVALKCFVTWSLFLNPKHFKENCDCEKSAYCDNDGVGIMMEAYESQGGKKQHYEVKNLYTKTT
jgi:hypothetical protein